MERRQLSELGRRTDRAAPDDGFSDTFLGVVVIGRNLDGIRFGSDSRCRSGPGDSPLNTNAQDHQRAPYWPCATNFVTASKAERGRFVLKAIVLIAVLGIFAMVLFDPSWRDQIRSLNPIPPGVLFGVLVVRGGFFFELKGLFVYAGTIVMTSVLTYVGKALSYAGRLVSGVAIVVFGFFLLARFVGRHPVHEGVAADA